MKLDLQAERLQTLRSVWENADTAEASLGAAEAGSEAAAAVAVGEADRMPTLTTTLALESCITRGEAVEVQAEVAARSVGEG